VVTHTLGGDDSPSKFQCNLLEINAEPAIELTGSRLGWILEDLFVSMGQICVSGFFGGNIDAEEDWIVGMRKHNLIKCLDRRVYHVPE
jgi:tubulin---tyrosine ligase